MEEEWRRNGEIDHEWSKDGATMERRKDKAKTGVKWRRNGLNIGGQQ